jgi:hypothetical protein
VGLQDSAGNLIKPLCLGLVFKLQFHGAGSEDLKTLSSRRPPVLALPSLLAPSPINLISTIQVRRVCRFIALIRATWHSIPSHVLVPHAGVGCRVQGAG